MHQSNRLYGQNPCLLSHVCAFPGEDSTGCLCPEELELLADENVPLNLMCNEYRAVIAMKMQAVVLAFRFIQELKITVAVKFLFHVINLCEPLCVSREPTEMI